MNCCQLLAKISEFIGLPVLSTEMLSDIDFRFSKQALYEWIGPMEKSKKIAMQICARLPHKGSEIEEMLNDGYELAKKMSSDTVVGDYLWGNLEKILQKQSVENIKAKLSA